MNRTPKAQGDLFVRPVSAFQLSGFPYTQSVIDQREFKQVTPGNPRRIHAGEGKNHFHVLEGNCQVAEVPLYMLPAGIKGWDVKVGEGGANLVHMHGNRKPTGEHGTATLEPGNYRITTQRELSNDDSATAVID